MANANANAGRGVRTVADLHERRKAAGLSQQRLAELAGCSLTFVRVVESGYSPATSAVLPRILAVLDGSTTSNGTAGNGAVAKLAGVGDGHGAP